MPPPTMGAFRLASLQLEGFKSFAGRAELSFPAPMTAIVGPNGAGKSNICDAIAWVLGEQSARLLRSQNMAEVIFAGSPRRPPLGAAEVVLHLAADDGRWPDTDGRLQVSRRVFADGTSEYRVNGRRVRLKDVVDQLMDAGLGTRSYAIIEQGRIGQVLAARAVERRGLFEEAAGITKYRARRHEAELKLAETRANLTRLEDVAAEVKRSLDSTRRQARRAERALELRRQLRLVRTGLYALRRAMLDAEITIRREALLEAEARSAAAAAALARQEAALVSQRRTLEALQERLAAARAEEARCDGLAQRREAEEAAARREHADALARAEAAAVEAARLATQSTELGSRQEELTARHQLAEAASRDRAQEATAAAARAGEAEEAAAHAVRRAEEARRSVLAAAASATEARNRVHRLEVELEQAGFQLQRLLAEQERLGEHHGAAAAAVDTAVQAERESTAAQHEREERRRTLRHQHDCLAARVAELTAALDRTVHQRWQVRHEHEGVQRALATSRALPQALARALPESALQGTVAEHLDPNPEDARLLDQACGELLAAPVVAGEEHLVTLLRATPRSDGRIQVVVASREVTNEAPALLTRAVSDPSSVPWLAAALPRIAAAEDAAAAVSLAAADPDAVVVIDGGSLRRGNRVEIPGREDRLPGVLELRRRERELAGRESELADRERGLSAELGEARAAVETARGQVAALEEEVRTGAETVAADTSRREAAVREQTRLHRELEALAGELVRLEEEAATIRERLAAARTEAERLEERSRHSEGDLDEAGRAAERARQDAAQATTLSERSAGESALARERALSTQRELARHRAELEDVMAREAARRREEIEQRQRAEQAATTAAAARGDLEELLARRTAARREAEQLGAAESHQRRELAAAEESAATARSGHDTSREEAHAARLALTETRGGRDRLEEMIALTLGENEPLGEPPLAEQLPELEAEDRRLSAALEAIGPINELAVAERDELESRHRFLDEQRSDLERSLATLAATVKELDATCAERFLATLQEANSSFAEVFRILFGGGDAAVELSDPDSPLDSGIEVRVRPPGKHTQSVLLLSGGEKALAAVALLLALFRIRPAPFCVLDEVDAPLDDANVERFCALLRRMTAETQFLLITHNRRTMAHADIIYGVTMDEPGVSRTVSVRLEE